MKVPNRGFTAIRRARSKDQAGVAATARLDRRTKNLTKRLKPGDIAIIDHIDLDRVAADALIRCQVLDAGLEIVQEIPDHATPVRRGHPAEWVAEVSSGQH